MEVDAQALFKELLKQLRPLFKKHGFRAYGQNFVLESPDVWGIVNFQKSQYSGPNEKTFYVNVAATAKRLLAFYDEPVEKAPLYYRCIWVCRIEQLGPDPEIKQWTIRDEVSASEVSAYLQPLLNDFAIPALISVMSEESLLNRLQPSQTVDYRALKASSILLASHGKTEELRRVVAVLVEEFGVGVVLEGVRDHLTALRSRFPDQMRLIES